MNTNPVLKLNDKDDVVIARQPVAAGTWLPEEQLKTLSDIPAGHKIAIRDIAAGEAVKRYGQIIGFATQSIRRGEHIHMQNLGMGDFEREYGWGKTVIPCRLPGTRIHLWAYAGPMDGQQPATTLAY